MNIAFLGLGSMGSAMALRLVDAGHSLTVWNRTAARADALVARGARLAATPAEAVANADVVCTMLFDDAAHLDVCAGGLLDALPPGAVHVVFSTISTALCEWLTGEHERRGRAFVAAPVFGRPNIAEAGKLWIVAAGHDEAIERARPVFDPISRGLTILGHEPRQAHALKLGGNFLISAMIHSLGESFVYAESQGIDPAVFLETINTALFQSPFYSAYANVMLHPPAHPGATMELGAKDLDLFRKAAGSRHVSLSLADQMAAIFDEARSSGLAQEDWAAGQYRMARRRSGRE